MTNWPATILVGVTVLAAALAVIQITIVTWLAVQAIAEDMAEWWRRRNPPL